MVGEQKMAIISGAKLFRTQRQCADLRVRKTLFFLKTLHWIRATLDQAMRGLLRAGMAHCAMPS
jgi:hypothetical protein